MVVVLLDGTSASGKTTLAIYLSKKLGIKYISFDKLWIQNHQKYPNKCPEYISKLTSEQMRKFVTHNDNIIVDNYVSYKIKLSHKIKRYLVYTPLSKIIKNYRKRLKYHPTKPEIILGSFLSLYTKSNKDDALDTLKIKDIKNILNLSSNTKNDKVFFNKIIHQLKFGKNTTIYIKPKYTYDKIIRMDKLKIQIKQPKL